MQVIADADGGFTFRSVSPAELLFIADAVSDSRAAVAERATKRALLTSLAQAEREASDTLEAAADDADDDSDLLDDLAGAPDGE